MQFLPEKKNIYSEGRPVLCQELPQSALHIVNK